MQKSRAGTASREVLCAAGALPHLQLLVLATSGRTSSDTVELVSRSLHCTLVSAVWLLSRVCSSGPEQLFVAILPCSGVSLRVQVGSFAVLTLLMDHSLLFSVVLGLLSRGRADRTAWDASMAAGSHCSDCWQGGESPNCPLCWFLFCFVFFLIFKALSWAVTFTSWSKVAASVCRLMDYYGWKSSWLWLKKTTAMENLCYVQIQDTALLKVLSWKYLVGPSGTFLNIWEEVWQLAFSDWSFTIHPDTVR